MDKYVNWDYNLGMDVPAEKPSRILEVVRNPMIFNALVVLVVAVLLWHSTSLDLSKPHILVVLGAGFGFILAVTVWLNIFAAINPRFLAYGPKEYLRESELEHERRMSGKN